MIKTATMLLLLAVIATACSNNIEDAQRICTADAKVCADGRSVGRDPKNNCAFYDCPTDKPIPVEPDGGIGTTPNSTDTPIPVEPDGGIGTTPTEKLKAIECIERGNACTKEYSPVCGWFTEDIKCLRYPCAATYGNACTACADESVAYYTEGECPIDDTLLR
jgi:hypothetical protein